MRQVASEEKREFGQRMNRLKRGDSTSRMSCWPQNAQTQKAMPQASDRFNQLGLAIAFDAGESDDLAIWIDCTFETAIERQVLVFEKYDDPSAAANGYSFRLDANENLSAEHVTVTKDGCEIITNFPSDHLISCGLPGCEVF